VKTKIQSVVAAPEGTCEAVMRPLRADALRNRARVLEAAEAVFASEGISAPVDVIAERAGVGVGTLYRHFPTKEKLLVAILVTRITEIAAGARARLQDEDPGAAFFGFLENLVIESTNKRDLVIALSDAGIEFEEAAGEAKVELTAAFGALLERAQEAGVVRRDVVPDVIMSLVSGTCMAAEHHNDAPPLSMLGIVCDGLRVTR
jgi:AcrR family transcriptional regulator